MGWRYKSIHRMPSERPLISFYNRPRRFRKCGVGELVYLDTPIAAALKQFTTNAEELN